MEKVEKKDILLKGVTKEASENNLRFHLVST